ncbi:MAG: ankyrin repeat domain-containing protein [Acidiferrobacterales bacterium]|nr:ankyrin repeat domain-containing protein [Acidiferrobacterales bacterium]
MFLFRETKKDWYLVALVLILSIGANLPDYIAQRIYINKEFLLLALMAMVAVSLVRYLKFALLLIVVILTIGANLPEQIAEQIGVDRTLLMLGLALMIATSFANKVLKLESGLEKKAGNVSLHGATALFKAISYGRITAVETLLENGVNVNVKTVSGITPLIMAATKGYADIVKLLLDHGAHPGSIGKDGKTAREFAEELGYTRVVEMIDTTKHSRSEQASTRGAMAEIA